MSYKMTILLTVMSVITMGLLNACSTKDGINKESTKLQVQIPLTEWKQQAQYTNLSNHRIAYWQAGNPEHETIILVHGFPAAAWDWQNMWQELSQDYHLVALDLLGYGLSDKPKEYAYTISEQADIVTGLAKQLDIKQYHLISHDYGVTVSQEILARHNETTAQQQEGFLLSLCLLNGGAFPEAQKHALGMYLLNSPFGSFFANITNKRIFGRGLSRTFGENTQPGKDHISGYWQLIEEQDGRSAFPLIIKYVDEKHEHRTRWVGAMESTKLPMRTIVGTLDELAGENILARYQELIPNPDIVRVANAGHFPQIEAPKEVLTAYKEFLDSVSTNKKI